MIYNLVFLLKQNMNGETSLEECLLFGIEINRPLWSTAWWIQAQTKSSTDLSITFIVLVHVPIEILYFIWLGRSGRSSMGDLHFIGNSTWVLKQTNLRSHLQIVFPNLKCNTHSTKKRGFGLVSRNAKHWPASATCIRVRSSCGSHHRVWSRERSWHFTVRWQPHLLWTPSSEGVLCSQKSSTNNCGGFLCLNWGLSLNLKVPMGYFVLLWRFYPLLNANKSEIFMLYRFS